MRCWATWEGRAIDPPRPLEIPDPLRSPCVACAVCLMDRVKFSVVNSVSQLLMRLRTLTGTEWSTVQ